MTRDLLQDIREEWGWSGIDPAEIVHVNRFGNLVIVDTGNVYWRICPEELSCSIIAEDRAAFNRLWHDDAFQTDWQMSRLAGLAREVHGPLTGGRVYNFLIPAVLGGAYDVQNIRTLSLSEYIAFAGSIAFQIKDLKDGDQVVLSVTD